MEEQEICILFVHIRVHLGFCFWLLLLFVVCCCCGVEAWCVVLSCLVGLEHHLQRGVLMGCLAPWTAHERMSGCMGGWLSECLTGERILGAWCAVLFDMHVGIGCIMIGFLGPKGPGFCASVDCGCREMV